VAGGTARNLRRSGEWSLGGETNPRKEQVVRVSQDPRTGLDSSVEQDPGVGRPTQTAEMPGVCRRTVRERRYPLESRGFQVARRAIEPTSPPSRTANRKRRAAHERRSSRTSPRKRRDSCGVSAPRKGAQRAPRTRPREGDERGGPEPEVEPRAWKQEPSRCRCFDTRRTLLGAEETPRPTASEGDAPPTRTCIRAGNGRNEASSCSGRKSTVREAMNGRRGAARSDAGRLPTRTKPSQGGAPRDPPRPIRREPQGTLTNDAGPTWRTPDPVPAATCREARTEEPVEVVRTHEDGTSGRSGILSPKPSAVSSVRASGRNRRTEREWTFGPTSEEGKPNERTRSSRRGRDRERETGTIRRIRPERRRRRNG